MRNVFCIFSLIGSIVGGLFVLGAFIESGAPQQAAIAAIGIGIAVVPYCFSRAVDELSKNSATEQRQTQIRLLAALTNKTYESPDSPWRRV